MAKKKDKGLGKEIKKVSKEFKKEADSFLADQPLWVWILFYAICGAVVFLLAWVLLTVFNKLWWLLLVVLVAGGAVYGGVSYSKRK